MSLLSAGIDLNAGLDLVSKQDPYLMGRIVAMDTRPETIARIFSTFIPFAKDESGNLYYYKDGVYKPNANLLIAELYWKLTTDKWPKDWKHTAADVITGAIKCYCPTLLDRPEVNLINLKNATYDWYREYAVPHSSDNLTTVQLPIDYDPDATCPEWDRFVDDILPVHGGRQLIYELIALLTIPHTGFQKAILLLGSGSNGKSTFLNGVKRFLGKDNYSSVSLHQLEEERFTRSMIVGKLVNIFSDLPQYKIEKSNVFKSLTGEDTIQIENKGQKPFSYTPFCRLIFSGNKEPKSDDETEGYKRRWLIIPFRKTFQVSNEGGEILDKLTSPRELSGLFNKVMEYLPGIMDGGEFTFTDEITDLIVNYQPVTESVKQWFKANIIEDVNGKIPCGAVCNFCQSTLGDSIVKEGKDIRQGFRSFLKSTFPWVKVEQVWDWRDGGVKIVGNRKCYTGIRLLNPERLLEFLKEVVKDDKVLVPTPVKELGELEELEELYGGD